MTENGTNRIAEIVAPPTNGTHANEPAAQPAVTPVAQPTTQPVDAEADLQKRLGEVKRRRAEACQAEINAALKKYRCELKSTQPQQTPEGGLYIPPRFEPFVLPLD